MDGIPTWEKKFCTSIGSVPWQKIVNVKDYIFCHDNVANWDDSAGKDAFQSAKRRFWEEINGIHSEHAFPDPDRYIDDVNWNPNIDQDLIEDLERSLFVPEEGEEDQEVECKRENKSTIKIISDPSEESNRNAGGIRAPAECSNNAPNSVASENKSQDWNQWSNGTNNSKNNDNPWECCDRSGNEAIKGNTWGDRSTRIKLQAWNKSEKNTDQLTEWNNCTVNNNDNNPWEQSLPQSGEDRSNGWHSGNPWKRSNWGNSGHNNWGNGQQEIGKMNYGGNQWERNFTRGRGNSKDRQWRGSGGNESSWRWSEDQFREPKDSGFRQPSRGWGTSTESHRKRGVNHQYATSNKHSRLGDGSYDHQWR